MDKFICCQYGCTPAYYRYSIEAITKQINRDKALVMAKDKLINPDTMIIEEFEPEEYSPPTSCNSLVQATAIVIPIGFESWENLEEEVNQWCKRLIAYNSD